jgi:spore maturation protein CgeB
MRIFYAADSTPNPALRDSRLWHVNLYLPLVDLGHEVVPFDYPLTEHFRHLDPSDPVQAEFIAAHRPKLERALLAQLERAHRERPIDLFFSYFYSAICTADTIRAIRALGIPTVNWYCNGSYQLHLVADIAPAYDYCLVPERWRLPDYRRLGANPIYFQEAANPTRYHPYDVPCEYDVTFVGQRYGDRPELLAHLAQHGVRAHVWGPGWLEADEARRGPLERARGWLGARWPELRAPEPALVAGPPLGDDELVAMYSRSRISLGFSSCGETHRGGERILQVRLRDFEAPMSGAFYLVEAMDELAEFFEPDKEVVFYRDRHELVDKVRYYLAHPAERETIRRAGMRRALAEHTWQHRFAKLFTSLGLP